MPQFSNMDTQRTQFWHARKFRDSTSVLKGGMCEDINSGYFAGAFMGRKFKSTPSSKEFDKSLEYLLDDLSSGSVYSETSARNLPSICSGSATSLDTVVPRDTGTPDSSVSSTRDGFMIDVTFTEKLKCKRRPRSDIFELLQGPSERFSDQQMLKTKSMCDVSHTNNTNLGIEAKQYEMEFESMLDELHSTIEDLDTFSRETIGVSLESLDSVSSVSKSGRVSPISSTSDTTSNSYSAGELKISEPGLSTDSNSSLSISGGTKRHSSILHISDNMAELATKYVNGYHTDASEAGGKDTQTTSLSDISSVFSTNSLDGSHCSNLSKSTEIFLPDRPSNKKGSSDGSSSTLSNKSKSQIDKGDWLKDKFQFLPDIATDCRRGDDVGCKKATKAQPKQDAIFHNRTTCIEKPGPTTNGNLPKEHEFDRVGEYHGTKHSPNETKQFDNKHQSQPIDLQKYTIKSHHTNHNFVVASNSPIPPPCSEHDPSASIMSSVTDLSGMGSEIGYIADMDESTFTETPDYNAPWLDAAIENNMESEMGDCFVQKGFRPLNFVGVESKYMISPIKGNELRIPTPVKLRREAGTQTCDEPRITSEHDYHSLNSQDNEDKQATLAAVCISTQTDNSLQCSCGLGSSLQDYHQQTHTEGFYKPDESRQKKNNIPYCSSVEISPLLNGSQFSNGLARANSLDTGLGSENKHHSTCNNLGTNKIVKSSCNLNEGREATGPHTDRLSITDRNRLQGKMKNQHLGVASDKCHLSQGQRHKASVKQPEIIVTVHNLSTCKQSAQSSVNEGVQEKNNGFVNCTDTLNSSENCKNEHNLSCRSMKCESVPNISSKQPCKGKESGSSTTILHQEVMRRYASVLIISNINRHLHQQSQENKQTIKRSSYERDVAFSQNNNNTKHQRVSKSPHKDASIGHEGAALTGSVNSQSINDHKRKIMSYTF